MSIPLTKRQQEVLDFLKKYYEKSNFSPSMREVAEHFGVSISTVQGYFNELTFKGAIKKHPNQSRAIMFKDELPKNMTISIPMVGVISAGDGIRVYEEEAPELIEIPSSWVNKVTLSSYYCLRVSGFSMFRDGILDGDIILVKQQASAYDGDTVVAIRIDGGEEKATLKVFYDRGDKIELKPRNENLKSIFVARENIEIRGKFCGLIREDS